VVPNLVLLKDILLVDKALYGLDSSGLRWHERLADVLQSIGFTQCKAEAYIWMRRIAV
jgi:hypothetical protein